MLSLHRFDILDPQLGRDLTAIVVLHDLVAYVHRPSRADPFVMFWLLEGDALQGRTGLLPLCEIHAQVFAFGADEFRIAPIADAACHEDRSGIALPAKI